MVIIPTEKRFDWERAPVALFSIVLLNLLIFVGYQSNDDEKFHQALGAYERLGYLDHEWPIFEHYLEPETAPDTLTQYRMLYAQGARIELSYYLLSDAQFFPYLRTHRADLPASEDFAYWQNRADIDAKIQSMSNLAFGLKPSDLHPITLLTHQFLHGSLMHLAGNLFFLVVCGFAVEAAIGHLRFLLFYLLSGVAGGLLYMALNTESGTTLVGASGAISGVMAMYLGVFRLRKIEFFYWFFIFVGFFRAPALLVLPFYIGKELYSYATDLDSNVAFMAHTGGFLSGAALMIGALMLNRTLLDEAYIEDDQQANPAQKALARIYAHIEKFQFGAALKAIEQSVAAQGDSFELALLRYNLLKLEPGEAYQRCTLALLKADRLRPTQLKQVAKIWHDNPDLGRQLGDDELLKLGWRLTGLADIGAAEGIFALLQQRDNPGRGLANFARKLAVVHDGLGNPMKKKQYANLAIQLHRM